MPNQCLLIVRARSLSIEYVQNVVHTKVALRWQLQDEGMLILVFVGINRGHGKNQKDIIPGNLGMRNHRSLRQKMQEVRFEETNVSIINDVGINITDVGKHQ